jgi:hypothetical protein
MKHLSKDKMGSLRGPLEKERGGRDRPTLYFREMEQSEYLFPNPIRLSQSTLWRIFSEVSSELRRGDVA